VKSLRKFPDPFLAEIVAQPAALRRAALGVGEQSESLQRLAEVEPLAPIVFTGMGASYDACYAPVTLLCGAGRNASMVDASELLHFRRAMLRAGTILVAVSQSGESAEIVRLVGALPDGARPLLVSVTNGMANPLAGAADVPLDTRAGAEVGPSTISFGATLVVLAALADVLSGVPSYSVAVHTLEESEEAAAAAERILIDPEDEARRFRSWLGSRQTVTLLGRGTARSASEAGSLILKEAARLPVEALAAAQFRHGPLELAGPGIAVAIVATEPETVSLDLRLAGELLDVGAAVMVVGATGRAPGGAVAVDVGSPARALAPAVAVVPFQLLAWWLAVEQGLDPGVLAIASKVTTRE